jgi:hypothetical protein
MRGIGVLLIVLTLLASGCGGDATPFQAAIDDLPLPSSWQVANTAVKGGSNGCIQIANPYCPSVTRYYTVSGKLPDMFQEAKSAIVAAGFGHVEELFPNCDLNTNGALCSINATKGDLRMEVNLYPPGDDVDSLGISVTDQPTVRITVRTASGAQTSASTR